MCLCMCAGNTSIKSIKKWLFVCPSQTYQGQRHMIYQENWRRFRANGVNIETQLKHFNSVIISSPSSQVWVIKVLNYSCKSCWCDSIWFISRPERSVDTRDEVMPCVSVRAQRPLASALISVNIPAWGTACSSTAVSGSVTDPRIPLGSATRSCEFMLDLEASRECSESLPTPWYHSLPVGSLFWLK